MILVELYSKEGCHLCDAALESLERIRQRHPFELRTIKITEGDEYFERFKERIPVIFVNGEFAYQYKLPERSFIARLGALSRGVATGEQE